MKARLSAILILVSIFFSCNMKKSTEPKIIKSIESINEIYQCLVGTWKLENDTSVTLTIDTIVGNNYPFLKAKMTGKFLSYFHEYKIDKPLDNDLDIQFFSGKVKEGGTAFLEGFYPIAGKYDNKVSEVYFDIKMINRRQLYFIDFDYSKLPETNLFYPKFIKTSNIIDDNKKITFNTNNFFSNKTEKEAKDSVAIGTLFELRTNDSQLTVYPNEKDIIYLEKDRLENLEKNWLEKLKNNKTAKIDYENFQVDIGDSVEIIKNENRESSNFSNIIKVLNGRNKNKIGWYYKEGRSSVGTYGGVYLLVDVKKK